MDASEYYRYYKRKYLDGISARNASRKKEESYISQRNQKKNQLSQCKAEKSSADKRLNDMNNIIKMLEGSQGIFGTNVPSSISKAEKALDNIESSFHKTIRLINGNGAKPDIKAAFEIKSVDKNTHSNAALVQFKKERSALQQKITNINNSISSLNSAISQLDRSIRACDSEQASLNRQIKSYLVQMKYWEDRM